MEDRTYDCGCNSGSHLRDAVGSLRKRTHPPLNSKLTEPGQPSAYLSKLIRPTACKKTKHTVSRWYRTVYIPKLVASYDTHKGKRLLNSNPPSHRGVNLYWLKRIILKGNQVKLFINTRLILNTEKYCDLKYGLLLFLMFYAICT